MEYTGPTSEPLYSMAFEWLRLKNCSLEQGHITGRDAEYHGKRLHRHLADITRATASVSVEGETLIHAIGNMRQHAAHCEIVDGQARLSAIEISAPRLQEFWTAAQEDAVQYLAARGKWRAETQEPGGSEIIAKPKDVEI